MSFVEIPHVSGHETMDGKAAKQLLLKFGLNFVWHLLCSDDIRAYILHCTCTVYQYIIRIYIYILFVHVYHLYITVYTCIHTVTVTASPCMTPQYKSQSSFKTWIIFPTISSSQKPCFLVAVSCLCENPQRPKGL